MAARGPSLSSPRLAAFAAAALATAGCVKDTREEPKRTVIANWSFPPAKPSHVVRLWPKETTTPPRKKHGVSTTSEGTALMVKVEDRDPYVMWDLEDDVAASSVRVSLKAPVEGPLELFWSSQKCPVFSQDCSQIATVSAGTSTVSFLLDPRQKTRGLRLDVPEGPGSAFAFEALDIFTSPELDVPWVGRAGQVTLETAPNGLTVSAAESDPWLTVVTPGLVAEWVTAVELAMPQSPAGTESPRLFWDGACGGFTEGCSKAIPAIASKAITHRVELGPGDKWTGPVRALRLDPGSSAGTYLVGRLTLVRGIQP
jgi:hypothetical protein